ncbi:hypothetical protein [Nonomuraea dietziae]|uniref:hypothetical protein n=1 Tax=Nonomuraea dietziae TaxID=65515 RepID=UPI003419A4AD
MNRPHLRVVEELAQAAFPRSAEFTARLRLDVVEELDAIGPYEIHVYVAGDTVRFASR